MKLAESRLQTGHMPQGITHGEEIKAGSGQRDLFRATRHKIRGSDARDMMRYYWETMDACVPPAAVLGALQASGLTAVKRSVVIGLFSEYSAVKV